MHALSKATLRNGLFALCALLASISAIAASPATPRVRLTTTMGVIVLELDTRRAPLTVANFLQYVKDGHYDATLFHRVIPGFIVQGGGYSDKNIEKPTRSDIVNESGNGLSNRRGTIAMARTENPHSATAQFYINLADNVTLDPQPSRWGYTVFGKVVEGLDIAMKIADVPTGNAGSLTDAPIKQVLIEKAEILP